MEATRKTEEELLQEEAEVDLETPVKMPPEVALIFSECLGSITQLPQAYEWNLDTLTDPEGVSAMLWHMYENPGNPVVVYVQRGDTFPKSVTEYQDSGYLKIQWSDHYYRRTAHPGDWYLLPAEYWSRADRLDESIPPAIRRILRLSPRHWKVEFKLTQKAIQSAERLVRRHELQMATRASIFEVKPGLFGISFNLSRAFGADSSLEAVGGRAEGWIRSGLTRLRAMFRRSLRSGGASPRASQGPPRAS